MSGIPATAWISDGDSVKHAPQKVAHVIFGTVALSVYQSPVRDGVMIVDIDMADGADPDGQVRVYLCDGLLYPHGEE